MVRFRSFRAGLVAALLGAVALAQLGTGLLVVTLSRHHAEREIAADLATATRVFDRVVAARAELLGTSARAVAGDFAFRTLFAAATDEATLQSAFRSARERVSADFVALADLDGALLAATSPPDPATLAALVGKADVAPTAEATAFGRTVSGRLYTLVIVPVRAPAIVAWLIVGHHIDDTFAAELRDQTTVDVSFAVGPDLLATSLPPSLATALAAQLSTPALPAGAIVSADLAGGTALLSARPVTLTGDDTPLQVIRQFSLDEKLAPARRLARALIAVALAGLALAAALGVLLARRLSRPVQALAAHTRLIAAGDYTTRLELDRADELGDLARAFNAMSTGLAERDRVRDLLDKNVSPAVAARLLREGAALGGEEREVTVLFCDLRGFTTLGEHLPPPELVRRLNRYLDRMSAVIEAEGGIIDKFIGDEIMALFGAPVATADDADRALRAARGMRLALATLNAEFTAESCPPLAFGIGLNTGRVVAGNIGSSRRLNYSVIGDAVNLAARLQTLTRDPQLAADILCSEATRQAAATPGLLRDAGECTVKGRAAPVRVWAVEPDASSTS